MDNWRTMWLVNNDTMENRIINKRLGHIKNQMHQMTRHDLKDIKLIWERRKVKGAGATFGGKPEGQGRRQLCT